MATGQSTTATNDPKSDTKGPEQLHLITQDTKKILLGWINCILRGRCITNFTTDWNDGIHLSALINYCQPGLIPNHASLDPSSRLENINNAMKLATEKFGIPQVMQPEDLAIDKPDELSVMTYLSYFCSSGSPGQKALLLWVQQQVTTLNLTITNLTTDWTDGRVLGALVNVISGGGFPEYEQMSSENRLENCRKSMDAAEKLLGVTKMIEPDEFVDPNLNQLKRMMYLVHIQFCRAMHAQVQGFHQLASDAPPHKVRVGELQIIEGVGTTVYVDVDCPQATGETVRAEVVGNTCGGMDALVERITPSTYRVKFETQKPDLYKLSLYYGKDQVKGSPFFINLHLPKADQVQHLSTSLPKGPGKPVTLSFDTKDAERGRLAVKASGESIGSIPVKIKPKANGVYTISFVPPHLDVFRVHVYWGLNAQTTGASVGPVSTEIKQDPKKDYKVSFRPPRPDVYTVDINWGKPVPNSPFVVNLLPKQPSIICGVPFYTGYWMCVPINPTLAAFGKISATCRGEESGEVQVKLVGPTCRGEESGVVQVKLVGPTCRGEESGEVQVKLVGPTCRGEESGEVQVKLVGPTCRGEESGEVQVKLVGPTCRGEESGEVQVKLVGPTKKLYHLSFIPPRKDLYMLSVFYNGAEIRNSPFTIDLRMVLNRQDDVDTGKPTTVMLRLQRKENKMATSDISKKSKRVFEVRFDPSKPDRYTLAMVLNKQHLPQNHSGARQTDLKAYATIHDQGKTGTKLKVKITKADGQYKLFFKPKRAGLYQVHVYAKDDKELLESPFPIQVEALNVVMGPEDIDESQRLGHPVQFHISTTHAGPGSLRFTSTGPGRAEVKVIDKKDGVYACEFNPTVPGKYRLSIFWNEEHIKGSPYKLNFISNRKSMVVSGMELERADFQVGVPYIFKLDCEEAGESTPKITCRPQNAAQISLTTVEGAHNHYHCEIVPTEPGNHEISVQYKHNHTLGSPFNVHFEPSSKASKCQVIQKLVKPGEEGMSKVQLCVSTEGAGEGELEASVRDVATKEPLTIDISKSREHYMLEFSIKHGMECLVSITYDQQHIPKSPFKLSFADSQGAACCHAEGEGLSSVQVGKPSHFIVSTANAGPGELSVKIEKEGEELEPTKRVSPLSDNQFEVKYKPTSQGLYIISVLWAKEHIPGSPFKVYCYNQGSTPLFSITEPVTETYVDMPLQFTVKAKNASEEGELEITLQSQSRIISRQGIKGEEGNYTCTISPPEPGKYIAHVRWNGEDIQGSPFNVKVMVRPKPENVRAYGPGLANGYVGQEGNFTVETEDGGAGILAVEMQGPQGAFKINMHPHPDNDRTMLVRYNPIDAGPYVIDITWSGVHIPGSPFKVNISDQRQLGTLLSKPGKLNVDKADDISAIPDPSFSLGQEDLLLWVQQQVATPNLTITNLTTDWTDGRVLGALVNVISDEEFPEYKQMSPENGLENCRKSIDAAEKLLGVKKTIEPEEFFSPRLDKQRRMAYLIQFYSLVFTHGCGSHTSVTDMIHNVAVGQLHISEMTEGEGAVSVRFNCPQAGSEAIRAEVKGTNGDTIDVQAKNISSDVYQVKFQPLKPDLYTLSIYYGEKEVKGSPFPISFNPPEASKVKHVATSLPKIPEASATLNFDTTDAGRGKLMVQAIGESAGTIPTKIEAMADGTYAISFKPLLPDIYKVHVHWGEFKAQAIGASVGQIPIEVEQEPSSDYKVSLYPQNPDVYTVDVKWKSKPVPGSPFTINHLPPPIPIPIPSPEPLPSPCSILVDLAKISARAFQICFSLLLLVALVLLLLLFLVVYEMQFRESDCCTEVPPVMI